MHIIDKKTLIRRLREIIESKFNNNASSYAEIAGISPSVLSRYTKGRSLPNLENGLKLAQAAGLTVEELCSNIPLAKIYAEKKEQIAENITKIPFLDMRASAGGGAFNETEFLKEIVVIKSEWVRSKLRPNHIFIMMVDGDSMVPTFDSGDMLLVNRSQELFHHNDGIYVFRRGETISVKRFQFLTNNIIRIISDNKENYQPELLDLKTTPEGEFEIIGRVFIVVKRLFKTLPH